MFLLVCLFACLFYKESGSYVHVCPRPCLSTYRSSQARNPPTQRTTLCVQPVLCCPLWPCDHRMCVIAKGTGLSPLARTCSRIWTFLRRLHVSVHHFLYLRPFTWETSIQKLAIIFPCKHGCSRCVLQCVFSAPPGAGLSLPQRCELALPISRSSSDLD